MIKRFIMAAGLFSSISSMAAMPIDGFYSSIFGGYTYLPNNIDTIHNGILLDNSSFTGGYNAGGRFGYKSNPLRYEGEFTYLSASAQRFYANHIKQTDVSGQSSGVFLMANVYYDFPEVLDSLQPFLGIGIGYGFVKDNLDSTGPGTALNFSGSNSVFSYQGTAGIAYHFAENYSLDLAYRYIATDHSNELGSIFQANLASVGVTYRFDDAQYK
ncbi:MAG: outer membrane beta-barrel protein [Legionellaceae bacterium]|nr:outer membrane beta-barrel protein [Legionellaceae bacterium]